MSKTIRIIAPSGKTSSERFDEVIDQLKSNGYEVIYNPDIYSDDIPYHANNDQFRANDLIDALNDPKTDIIWCFRGGYGSARLYEYLKDLKEVPNNKILVGFSDITALHLILSQEHGLKTIHSHVLNSYTTVKDNDDFKLLEDILFNNKKSYSYEITAYNEIAKCTQNVEGKITGGNLCVISSSLGTDWQIDTTDKILFLEDIGEPGYKIDRMLNQLNQAHLLDKVKAVVLGNFKGEDPYMNLALERFADDVDFPVYKCDNFGHDNVNYPFQYGTNAEITLGNDDIASIHFEYFV